MYKVLIINTSYSEGGAAKIARELFQRLNNSSAYQTYFAYGRGKKGNGSVLFKFGNIFEFYFHAFLMRLLGIEGKGSYFSTKELINFIKREKFDLIHLHNLHGYYLNFFQLIEFLKNSKIPVVWTLHDEWSITGRCAHPSGCNRWRMGCGRCPDLSLYPKTFFFDFSGWMWGRKKNIFSNRWNPIIVCPSQWLASRIRESYLNKYLIGVVPNGVDANIFRPKNTIEIRRKLGISLNKKVILFIAADLKSKEKGIKYFFDALKYLRANNSIVITVGKQIGIKEHFKSGIPVKQLGYISDSNLIADVYNAADIFCITSLEDTFPTTVLESMACGVPVVGFRAGGVPEQVSGNCGILVESKDVKELAAAINELLNDNEKRNTFSRNCRKRVLENYSIEKFKDRYISLYKKVLNR